MGRLNPARNGWTPPLKRYCSQWHRGRGRDNLSLSEKNGSKILVQKYQIWGWKSLPFWGNLGTKLKFWALIISSVGNLQLSVGTLQLAAPSSHFVTLCSRHRCCAMCATCTKWKSHTSYLLAGVDVISKLDLSLQCRFMSFDLIDTIFTIHSEENDPKKSTKESVPLSSPKANQAYLFVPCWAHRLHTFWLKIS